MWRTYSKGNKLTDTHISSAAHGWSPSTQHVHSQRRWGMWSPEKREVIRHPLPFSCCSVNMLTSRGQHRYNRNQDVCFLSQCALHLSLNLPSEHSLFHFGLPPWRPCWGTWAGARTLVLITSSSAAQSPLILWWFSADQPWRSYCHPALLSRHLLSSQPQFPHFILVCFQAFETTLSLFWCHCSRYFHSLLISSENAS